jgi:hypothetical protein
VEIAVINDHIKKFQLYEHDNQDNWKQSVSKKVYV